jgi:hypothetical protein
MTTIDKTNGFHGLVPLDNRTHAEYYDGLDKVLRFYNRAGFRIRTIFCDGEFKAMMDRVSDDLDVVMNYTNALDHVPEAERNNRTIKERFRSAFHRLPYKKIPKTMIKYLAMVQTSQLNLFPAKGGVSKHYSPRAILTQQVLEYDKHCKIPFGSFVQANHETDRTNSNIARTIDCIYLRPSNTIQGGHELMDLTSGRVITRNKVTVIPISEFIIQTVERMADEQGMKEIKFKNRFGEVYPDVDVITGVEHHLDQEDPEDEDEDYENNNDDGIIDDDDGFYDEEIDDNELEDLRDEANDYVIVPNPPDPDDRSDAEEEIRNENEDEEEPEAEVVTDEDTQGSELRRSTRQRTEVQRLEPTMRGQSYLQDGKENESILRRKKFEKDKSKMKDNNKVVSFLEDKIKKMEVCHNIIHQTRASKSEILEYEPDDTMIMARLISDLQNQVKTKKKSFAQQYILQKGLKLYGSKGYDAALKELEQLYKRTCFEPVNVNELTAGEKKKAQQALMFLCEKRDGTIKGRMVYNGKPTREWLNKEDVASPTASLEAIILTCVIDSYENRDVMTADIPNAFIQAEMPEIMKGNERIMMKIQGILVDMLVDINPNLYSSKIVFENGKKVIYVWVLKAIYGMLEAALLWYKKFKLKLEQNGFKFNPYDPCVANKDVKGKQQTIIFHVDDLKSSHQDPKVNDEFEQWLNFEFGEHGKVTTKRGLLHDYLGMTLDYTEKGAIIIDMKKYVSEMLTSFPIQFTEKQIALTPSNDKIFNQDIGKALGDDRKEIFHTTVAKGLFLAKRGRPDIQGTIAMLCTRVKAPNEGDWNKLIRLMKYLNGTREKVLRIKANSINIIKWYVDASYAVHPDFRSQTGAVMVMGEGSVQNISRKQKINTRSSTESELVAVDDAMTMILWTKLFMEAQGYNIDRNILYQDNKSSILLETNGRKSAGKRSRALNVRYFFVTDQMEKGNLQIEYCQTEKMTADYHTKPLQGSKFAEFRAMILGEK